MELFSALNVRAYDRSSATHVQKFDPELASRLHETHADSRASLSEMQKLRINPCR